MKVASFWGLYCQLWTCFTPCSSVSIVNSEQVNAGWVASSNEIKTHIVLKIVGVNLTGARPTKLQYISLDLGKLPIVMKLKSIYAEPSSETLLKYCLHGLTQSQNENFIVLNSDRILKTHASRVPNWNSVFMMQSQISTLIGKLVYYYLKNWESLQGNIH